MKNLICFVLLLLSAQIQAQTTVSRQLIGSSGGSLSGGSFDLDFSAGEAVIETVSSGSVIVSQGFQQPFSNTNSLDELEVNDYISLYPNPTNDVLNLTFTNDNITLSSIDIKIYNLQGQQVFSSHEDLQQVNFIQLKLDKLKSGHYHIQIKDENGVTSRAKFIKY